MENYTRLNLIILLLMTIIVFLYVNLMFEHTNKKVKCYDLFEPTINQIFKSKSSKLDALSKSAEAVINSPENRGKRIVSTGTTFICLK